MLEKLFNKPPTVAELIYVGLVTLAIGYTLVFIMVYVFHADESWLRAINWIAPAILVGNAIRAHNRFYRIFFNVSAVAILAINILRMRG